MILLNLLLLIHKIVWPLLFLSIFSLVIGGLCYFWWDPKRKMKDDPGAYNFKMILGAILFTGLGIWMLIKFILIFFG
jgi:hypothetical protein